MSDTDIKPEDLDYATFAATLNQLNDSDRASAASRVQQLLRASKNRMPAARSTNQYSDEATAFRADIAAEVLREFFRAGKINRLIFPTE
jgi:hypothetical protein